MVEIFKFDDILTVAEVARRLRCSRATIRDWIFHKKIPYYKINGKINFLGYELNEWFHSKAVCQDGCRRKTTPFLKMKKADKKTLENFNRFLEKLKQKN